MRSFNFTPLLEGVRRQIRRHTSSSLRSNLKIRFKTVSLFVRALLKIWPRPLRITKISGQSSITLIRGSYVPKKNIHTNSSHYCICVYYVISFPYHCSIPTFPSVLHAQTKTCLGIHHARYSRRMDYSNRRSVTSCDRSNSCNNMRSKTAKVIPTATRQHGSKILTRRELSFIVLFE